MKRLALVLALVASMIPLGSVSACTPVYTGSGWACPEYQAPRGPYPPRVWIA